MALPLLIAAGAAASAVAGVVGWRARGAADEFNNNVQVGVGTVNTVQLVLIVALIYGGYRFVKEFR